MIYNITDTETARQSLSNLVNISENKIDKYILNVANQYCPYNPEEFIKYMKIDISTIDISQLYFFVQHITTNHYTCKDIKKYGLMNLQKVLTEDTNLKRHLLSVGISVDVIKGYIYVESENESSKKIYLKENMNDKLKKIYRKIYHYYGVNGFLCMKGKKDYADIHRRPQFLFNINDMFRGNIKSTWERDITPYIISYRTKLKNVSWKTFYKHEYNYKEDYIDQIELNKEIIKKSLQVIWRAIKYESTIDIYLFMKSDFKIPYSDILNIEIKL